MRRIKGGIAFFDSGIGGLTVMHACRKRLPNVLFYYYGDNTHAPYGNLPVEKIKKYVWRAFKLFKKLEVSAVVVACNTVTAVCVEELRASFSFPIIGAEPAVFSAARIGGEVLILTTRATYESSRFRHLCDNARRVYSARLKPYPCDGLAGVIEKHLLVDNFDYTSLLPKMKPNVVVLGCTHYLYVAKQIADFYQCPVVDGNQGLARQLEVVLRENNLSCEHLQPPNDPFQPFVGDWVGQGSVEAKKRLAKKVKKRRFLTLFFSKRRKGRKVSNYKGLRGIIFLGNCRKYNKNKYEHLFM